jgi:hypothetical protein
VTKESRESDRHLEGDCKTGQWGSRGRVAILATLAVIGILILGCSLLTTERVLRLSDGFIEDRLFFAGIFVGSSERQSVVAPFRLDQSKLFGGKVVSMSGRVQWLRTHKTPSTYGGRLAVQCYTAFGLLEVHEASDSEAEVVWRRIAERALGRQPVDDIVDSLVRRP